MIMDVLAGIHEGPSSALICSVSSECDSRVQQIGRVRITFASVVGARSLGVLSCSTAIVKAAPRGARGTW